MEYQKANEHIDAFIIAMNTLKIEAANSVINKTVRDKCEQKVNELLNEMKVLKQFKRKYDLIRQHPLVLVEVCNACDGYGGGADGDEYSGYNEWACDVCEGSGIVNK